MNPRSRSDIETRICTLTAEQLGVTEGELSPALSLVDDLAADSLDLAELAVALEDTLGIALPDTTLESVRTFGDLLDLVLSAVDGRRAAEPDRGVTPIRVVARLARPAPGGAPLERTGELTPYFTETLVDDAR